MQNAIGKLLARPKPKSDESVFGYLQRIANANGYPDYKWILESLGLPKNLPFQECDVGPLAEKLGISETEIVKLCYWVKDSHPSKVQFRNATIQRRFINTKRPRVCVACLKGDAYARAIWDIGLSTACPTHRMLLIDGCPKCRSPYSWNKGELCKCHNCGYDVRLSNSKPATKEQILVQEIINKKLLQDIPNSESETLSLPILTPLPANELMSTILMIGAFQTRLFGRHWHLLCARLSVSKMTELTRRAAEVFNDWPESFHALLKNQSYAINTDQTTTGSVEEFGSFYASIRSLKNRREMPFLHEEFKIYLKQIWGRGYITPKNTIFEIGDGKSDRYATRAEAARELHIRPETIDQLLLSGVLVGKKMSAKKRTFLLVDRISLAKYKVRYKRLITHRDVCAILGISKKPVNDLIKSKLIRPVLSVTNTLKTKKIYQRTEVVALLSCVEDQNQKVDIDNDLDITWFEVAVREATYYKFGVKDIVKWMLAGDLKLKAVDDSKVGLKRFLVSKNDLEQLLNRKGELKACEYTIPDAARRMRLKEQVMYDLANSGLLSSTIKNTGIRYEKIVSKRDLDNFRELYIPASELAYKFKTSPRHVVKTLANSGVSAATGPSIDGSRKYFFLRRSVEMQNLSDDCFSIH